MQKDLITFLVRSLVDDPNTVRVVEKKDQGRIIFSVHVEKGDFGKVIGRAGKTVQAIKSLVHAVSADSQTLVSIDVIQN